MAWNSGTKGLRPLQIISIILFVRLLSVFAVQTWYVPDEYWQTLEVAHKQVFGYGSLTWEWEKGIRSYLYPTMVATLYMVLKYTGLDYPDLLVYLPRILQAVLSTIADYSLYKWTGGRKWSLFLILTSWFWFYTSGRTLLQSIETVFVAVALSQFPFKDGKLGYYEKESTKWIWLAFISFYMRPTSVALWIILGVYNLWTTYQGRLRLIVRTYVPIGIVSTGALIGLDSYFYGRLIFTPWEFFRFNILRNLSSFYGTHPWHWYLSQGLPAILGINVIPVLLAVFKILRRPKENKTGVLLLSVVTVHVLIYSCISHKEFRFMLPLLPILTYLAQDVIVSWSRKAKKWQLYIVAAALLLSNAAPAVYFGVVHQRGPLKLMPLLREAIPNNRSSILFMMPCHSTPLYSHLHVNVTTRYLHCNPTTIKPGETDEAHAFFNNPQHWWRAEYSNRQTPNLIVMFDVLRGRVEGLLSGYKQLYELPHTQFPEGEVSEKILVYKKTNSKTQADPAI